MSELNKLMSDIEELRANLIKIFEQKKTDLQDQDVISASEILDAAIVKYNELLKKKLKASE